MADEPDNLAHRLLRDIRAKQDEHSAQLQKHSDRFDDIDRHLTRLSKVVTFTLGQTTEMQLQQTEHEKRIDGLFDKVERLMLRSETDRPA